VLEGSLLVWLLPGIESGNSSGVPDEFDDISTTHIIAIYGFKMSSCDALIRDSGDG
jgi:hypothetical protein